MLESVRLKEKQANDNPGKYDLELYNSYTEAADYYKNQSKYDKASDFYKKAEDIIVKLAVTEPDKYNENLATHYNKTGYVYFKLEDYNKAEEYYTISIAIRENAVKANDVEEKKSIFSIFRKKRRTLTML